MVEVVEMKARNIETAKRGLPEHESGKIWRRTENKHERYRQMDNVCRESSSRKLIGKKQSEIEQTHHGNLTHC